MNDKACNEKELDRVRGGARPPLEARAMHGRKLQGPSHKVRDGARPSLETWDEDSRTLQGPRHVLCHEKSDEGSDETSEHVNNGDKEARRNDEARSDNSKARTDEKNEVKVTVKNAEGANCRASILGSRPAVEHQKLFPAEGSSKPP